MSKLANRLEKLLEQGINDPTTVFQILNINPAKFHSQLNHQFEIKDDKVVRLENEVGSDAVSQRKALWSRIEANGYDISSYRLKTIFNLKKNTSSRELASKWGVTPHAITTWSKEVGLFSQSRVVYDKHTKENERVTLIFTKANTLKALKNAEKTYLEDETIAKEFEWVSTDWNRAGLGFDIDKELAALPDSERDEVRSEYWLRRSKLGIAPRVPNGNDHTLLRKVVESIRGI